MESQDAKETPQLLERIKVLERENAALAGQLANSELLFDQAPLPYQALSSQAHILKVNQSWLDMLGYAGNEVTGRHFKDFVCESSRKSFANHFARLLSKGRAGNYELWLRRSDGSKILVEIEGRVVRGANGDVERTQCVLKDMTLKNLYEAKLRASEEEKKVILDNISLHVALQDLNSRFIWVNQSILDFVNLTEEEVVGQLCHKLYFNLDQPCPDCPVLKAHDGETHQHEMCDVNGRWWLISGNPIKDDAGKTRGVVEVAQEITDLKRLEEQLILSKEEAEKGSRAKTAFLANMSHELRTPISGIMGMTDMLLALENRPDRSKYLKLIKEAGSGLMALVNDILDLSKIESHKIKFKFSKLNLEQFLESAILPLAEQAKAKHLDVSCRVSPRLPAQILSDPDRLSQILRNLLGNAIKFTQEGRIDIEAAPYSEDESKILFKVADTGIGIAPELQPRLFKSFTQLDDSLTKRYAGAGLGLAICKQLVEMLGGKIWVQSQEGQGATFFFTISLRTPVCKGSLKHQKPPKTALQSAPLNVLVAEDDLMNLLFVEHFLSENGFKVTTVRNGEQALQAIENQKFDLVLMDIRMEKISGEQATRRLRAKEEAENLPRLPIIALTAYAMKGDKERCLAAGMDGYASKPIEMDNLLEVIGKVMAKYPRPE